MKSRYILEPNFTAWNSQANNIVANIEDLLDNFSQLLDTRGRNNKENNRPKQNSKPAKSDPNTVKGIIRSGIMHLRNTQFKELTSRLEQSVEQPRRSNKKAESLNSSTRASSRRPRKRSVSCKRQSSKQKPPCKCIKRMQRFV